MHAGTCKSKTLVLLYTMCVRTFFPACAVILITIDCILLTEANLKRLRDINEEIQKLRMVNSQRGPREVLCNVVFYYVTFFIM